MFKLSKGALVLALLMVAVGGAGIAWATIPDSSGVYTACEASDGTIRLIDPSLGDRSPFSHCNRSETLISWNQQGQPGAKGDPGTPGAAPLFAQTDLLPGESKVLLSIPGFGDLTVNNCFAYSETNISASMVYTNTTADQVDVVSPWDPTQTLGPGQSAPEIRASARGLGSELRLNKGIDSAASAARINFSQTQVGGPAAGTLTCRVSAWVDLANA